MASVYNTECPTMGNMIPPGERGFYKGFAVVIRRVAIIAGKAQYWILMPERTNSFAWVQENEITKEPQ